MRARWLPLRSRGLLGVLVSSLTVVSVVACGIALDIQPDLAPLPAEGGSDAGSDGAVADGPADAAPDAPTDLCVAIDLQRDPQNCGTCRHSCGALACLAGNCVADSCDAGTKGCANPVGVLECVDLQTNGLNCGTCAHACNENGDCVGGECARTVFVTQGVVTIVNGNANIRSLTDADKVCQDAAAAGGLKNAFKAWLSDSNAFPANRFTLSKRPYNLAVSQTLVATDFTSLTNQNLHAPIDTDALGNTLAEASPRVWTGTRSDGHIAAGQTCSSWSDSSFAAIASAGVPSSIDLRWTESVPMGVPATASISCSSAAHLYCFEQ